jgi:hypothetical protein
MMPSAALPYLEGHTKRVKSNGQYPISLEVRYRLLEGSRVLKRGVGRTVYMSSNRILFESEAFLPLGTAVELMITWPVRLDSRIELKLFIAGQIVQVDGKFAVTEIRRHEFRTRGGPVETSSGYQPLIAKRPPAAERGVDI